MIKLTLPVLAKLWLGMSDICTTLENRIKCGLGKRGCCNTGRSYACQYGPVYMLAEFENSPAENCSAASRYCRHAFHPYSAPLIPRAGQTAGFSTYTASNPARSARAVSMRAS